MNLSPRTKTACRLSFRTNGFATVHARKCKRSSVSIVAVRVTSVEQFVHELALVPLSLGRVRFFRGHADFKRYKIRPSIYRHPSLISNEGDLIQEAIIRCPANLPDSCTFFEKLVR